MPPLSRFERLVGVGGIGTGMFFALEGDHDLGRNESRPARLLDVRDYCKLHIITHYVATLLEASPSGTGFHVLPVGKVGDDGPGRRLLEEMERVGIDTRCVERLPGRPTLFSVCFQYPDGSGGNITTSDSAAAALHTADLSGAASVLAASGPRAIALAAPEVPLEIRDHLLKLATTCGAFRAAAFTSTEITEALQLGMLSRVDLLAMNEDEAAVLAGQMFDMGHLSAFLSACAGAVARHNPRMLVVVSAGEHGAWALEQGRWDHCPAPEVEVASTAGAGDALLAGVLAGLARGLPLQRSPSERGRPGIESALDLGVWCGAFSVTSPHTIHPDFDLRALLSFAAKRHATVSPLLARTAPV